MKLAADKIGHLKAGVEIALLGAVIAVFFVGLVALASTGPATAISSVLLGIAAAGALVAGVIGGIVKEKADALDNAIQPGMHEVSAADAIATAAPGVVLCALLLLLAWAGSP